MLNWLDFKRQQRLKILKWLLALIAIFLVVAGVIGGAYFWFEKKYQDRIYPGIYVDNINLSGLTLDQARMILNQRIDKINQSGINFYYQNNQATLFPLVTSASPDLAYEIITFNIEKDLETAFQTGRNSDAWSSLKEQLKNYFNKKYIYAHYTVNEEAVDNFFVENFSRFENPGTNAKLVYENNNFSVSPEKTGTRINYDQGLMALNNNLSRLDNSPIELAVGIDYPRIFKKDCLNIDAKAKKLLAHVPIVLTYKNKSWWIDKNKLIDWLTLKINSESKSDEDKIIVALNYELMEKFFQETIAPDINQEPIEAKLEIKDGKVVEFQNSQDGLELNVTATIKKLEFDLVAGCLARTDLDCEGKDNEVKLIVRELKSEVQTNEVNDLGIKEIIGTGHSNFAGSPSNRRHNIAVGAAAVNGTLVKPGDEFSLLNVLGAVDAESGYLPELVIKEGKTIPEYGGGLCQIGTTMFRATYESGMPVTLRRNHSYRVSYYEPAGTDATIYDPWPDYRFKNDSPYHILIQSRIEGDDLYFDFWSTEDGRVASSTYPIISNIVRPESTKIIETLDLKPGEKKCTERAHNGADAYFDYTVTYPDGEVKEERFSSHYVPWREVCLLGVEKLSATTTEEVIEE